MAKKKLRVFVNPLGKAVVATTLEEALAVVRKHHEKYDRKVTGHAMKYEVVPDNSELLVFERYTQRFVPMKAQAWAKRLGFGVPNRQED